MTGHHTKDFSESLFLHLTRGGGKRAFYTLPPFDGSRFLPLVYFTDEELEILTEYVIQQKMVFEDLSNFDTVFKRNRIRHEILPLLEKENWNHYKTYWNFHEQKDLLYQFESKNKPENKSNGYLFRIPHQTWILIDAASKKELLDFHLKQMGFYPLYRSGFENFRIQAEGERAYLENKLFVLYKSKFGDLFIIGKKSPLFLRPVSKMEGDFLSIQWNDREFKIYNPDGKYSLGTSKPGEKIEIRSGKKEISECMRENGIPFFLRPYLPILYYENRPIQILFSLFSESEKNYPKRIYLEFKNE